MSEAFSEGQREIDEIVPGDRLPSLDDKSCLSYTEAVILEIMRRHIVAPFLIRHTSLKETKVLDYDVPKGCQVNFEFAVLPSLFMLNSRLFQM